MYYIGVDLGGTNIAVGIVDENKRIVAKGSVPTALPRDGDLIVKDMTVLSERLLKEAGVSVSEVAYAGIASPGAVNTETGTIEYTNNLGFRHYPIADVFKKYLPIKAVLVENDANAAALGEALAGAAKGSKNSVTVTLGTGVGGGIIIDGKVYSGFNHAAGEVGHIVIEHGGRYCSCGRRGCWEAYSSATALSQMTKEMIIECETKRIPTLMLDEYKKLGKVTARTAFDAQKKGDAMGMRMVETYIDYLACGIANMINMLQPEILCIGGGVCNEGDNLLKPLIEKVSREQYTRDDKEKTRIVIAALGNDAGIIGAACLGLQ